MARNFGLPIQGETDMAEKETPATGTGTITITNEQLQMLMQSAQTRAGVGTLTAEDLAKAFTAQTKRENTQSPMVSVYNPRGERDHPGPKLRAKTTQNGIELREDTLTIEEIEALNALQAGVFRVRKANGSQIPFTVNVVRGFDGEKIERVDVHYPCKDEHRYDHRGLLEYCVDALAEAGQTEAVTRLTALRTELDGLRKKSA